MILAGDVGGTKTNLALFIQEQGSLRTISERRFENRNYCGLGEVAAEFLADCGQPVQTACFGIAGYVEEGRSRMPNLSWVIDSKQLEEELSLKKVVLLNDLEATGYGVSTLREEDFQVISRGDPKSNGNAALIAAGTGLGEAFLFRVEGAFRVSPSEGGHSDFAPRTEEQIELLRFLTRKFGHVSVERVVSGPGLHNIYQYLQESSDLGETEEVSTRISQSEDPSALISELALEGRSERCTRALRLFVETYAAEAGNLALKGLATAGVFIGGGIAPKILPSLQDGLFMKSFSDKGRYSELVGRIPVKVVLEPKTALRGAASYLFRFVS